MTAVSYNAGGTALQSARKAVISSRPCSGRGKSRFQELTCAHFARRRSRLSGPAPFATSNRKPPAIETLLRNMIIDPFGDVGVEHQHRQQRAAPGRKAVMRVCPPVQAGSP